MRVTVDDITPGMVLASDARNRHGQVLLKAGTTVATAHIRTLKTWGVASVQIADDESRNRRKAISRATLEQAAVAERKRFKYNDLGASHVHAAYLLAVKRRALAEAEST